MPILMLLPALREDISHPIFYFVVGNAGTLYVILNGNRQEPIKNPFCANNIDDFDPIIEEGSNRLAIWLVKNLNIEKKPEL